ncbi:MAG: hypothetical protein HKL91_05905 [Candidatus Eremiobacteraeota bacterium]|uniref:NHL repeat containing protein n=1 Tax=mine drainage metagenome TaxID=410659 RepID=E6PEI1_9ZZZZ|nr:hypothetical protein [Candidatus Eremiobacteraeota bacterium]
MQRSSLLFTLALYGAIALLGDCAGHATGGGLTPPTSAPSGPTPLLLTRAGGPFALPTAGGYSGSMQLPANNAPSGTTMTLDASTTAPVGAPTPQALRRAHGPRSPQAVALPTVLFVLTIQVSQNVTFQSAPSFSFQLPAGISTVNESFFVALFDGESAQAPLLTTIGPASISGSTLNFSGNATPLTLDAGTTYLAELYEVATGATATPSPLPSSAPTIAPTATPTIAPTATPTTTPTAAPAASPAAGTLYELSYGSSYTFGAFAPGANGNVAPLASYYSAAIQAPTGIAVDATGRAYVVAYGPAGTEIYSYAYGASGNATPSTTLTTDASGWGLAIDPATDDLVATDANNNIVEYFAPAANGSASPLKTISGANTGFNLPYQVAFDGSENIYVVNGNGFGSVVEFAAGASGNATPIATIAGSATGLDGPEAIAVDSTGRVYVGNSANDTITVYAPGANGNVAPSAVIQGGTYDFLIDQAIIAVDASNDLYVFGRSNEIEVFAPVTGSPQAPIRTITGSSTGIAAAEGVAIVP